MNKLLYLLLFTFIILAGCDQVIEEPQDESVRFSGIHGNLSIITDNETGCKYIREQFGQGVSLTELLKSDGTPDCEQ